MGQGNAWPLEQGFVEIISGNPNVDKSLAGLGMRDDSGRLERSSTVGEQGGEMEAGSSGINRLSVLD